MSTPAVEPTSLTQPNEPEFKVEASLRNEELSPFSEDKDEVLRNQPCQILILSRPKKKETKQERQRKKKANKKKRKEKETKK